ncbi:MAG: GNAT family N-acetyltransferase [Beijerinckiaceae bacterium]
MYDPAQLPALADLWVESWNAALPEIDFEARRGWFLAHMTDHAARGEHCLVALNSVQASPSGFVLFNPGKGWLDQICILRNEQGSGLAVRLLAKVKAKMPKGFMLDVNAGNPRAIRFYERSGLVRIGEGVNPRSGLATFRYHWRP